VTEHLVIKLIRHGQSQGNVGEVHANDVGDHAIALTPHGHHQARDAGAVVGRDFLDAALLYCSPYRRTRETMAGVLAGAGLADARVMEDPRLREVEHGYEPVDGQSGLRRTHGWFYYRFPRGESPADCFDRTSSFIETMMRQVQRKRASKVLIVSHGLTIRCFVMRWLHLSVEQFDELANPANAAIITLAPREQLRAPRWVMGRWGVEGLEVRDPDGE
jgi:broad specificity phosphatase PhoE